jgi:glutathione S-transferase
MSKSTPSFTLYGHPLSSCTRKVLFACAEKAESTRASGSGDTVPDVELVTVDLFSGEHHGAAHLARHPFGVIPVLDHDGFSCYESRAILRYVDRVVPGRALSPSGARDAARMDQWLSVDQSYVGPHTRMLAIHRLVRPHQGLAGNQELVDEAERELARTLEVYDRALADTRFLVGDELTLADISLAPYIAGLPMLQAQHLVAPRRHLGRWWEDVSSRPAWKQIAA